MDFSLSEEQRELKEGAIAFARKSLNEGLIEREKKGEFSWEGWKRCAEFGIQRLPIPKVYGGSETDLLTTLSIMEGLGYGCKDNGLIFSINAHLWACEIPIWIFGSEEHKRTYLPRLCNGGLIGAHALTEPDAGSDAYAIKTVAERKGDRYLLNGRKTMITNAPIADLFLVFANIDPQKGLAGITGFLIEKGTPGLSVGRTLEKMGLRTAQMGEVILDQCEIPVENRLGKEGAGWAIFNTTMEWERGFILAGCVGAMERQMEECIRYAKTRRQFGKPIGKFQSVSNRLVEMQVRLETSRLLLYKVGWLKKTGKRMAMEAAIAKLYISESAVKSALDAIQVHGGYGCLTEFEIERELRDTIPGLFYSGTTDVQKNIIAQWMGL